MHLTLSLHLLRDVKGIPFDEIYTSVYIYIYLYKLNVTVLFPFLTILSLLENIEHLLSAILYNYTIFANRYQKNFR